MWLPILHPGSIEEPGLPSFMSAATPQHRKSGISPIQKICRTRFCVPDHRNNSDGRGKWRSSRLYSKGSFHWYSRGYNPGGVESWNAIRGLDLLSERPEVDPERLGVTGISGGGVQSWIYRSSRSTYKSSGPGMRCKHLKEQIGVRTIDGHCDCMMPINTYQKDLWILGH